ncbi:amino acid ABC transporter substrate-binding protein [Paucibacter sp. PLA-PC-4]|uniref:amino acid ABC transporter substrate-binding protein n=1 Tax=Paucibacter sp. PLA-PC-4 TaxID=2993655 RepID=UPI00224B8E0E|nr:amino acid ABC transporter substrate-binding protein [Paucibacter sp. PLA-PC-4]MCX2865786.1 amino acid ABC transporter substrate-binding protein [Paucibacter sp. PLA-PC-4]
MRFLLPCLLCILPLWAAAADGPSISRIRDTGVIVMGYRPASLPFSYLDANLKPIGYSIELCERVIAAVKRELKLPELEVKRVAVSSATRLPMVANGMLDMECGITTNNAERARNQAFSITTFVTETKLLSRSVDGIRSLRDLRGKPVASTIGTTSIQYLHSINEQEDLGFRILAGLDDPEAFHLLRTGRARAFMMDDVLLRSMLAQLPSPQGYEVSEQALTVEPYGIGLSRHDPAFKQLVDSVLIGLYRSGEIFAIYRRWFESPIPPLGINLQLPMSAAFKRVIAQPTDTPDPAHYR